MLEASREPSKSRPLCFPLLTVSVARRDAITAARREV